MNNSEVYKESIGGLLKETDNINFEIRMLRHNNQDLTAENDKKIAHLQENLLEKEAMLQDTLTKSKEDVIKVRCGWAHFRIMPDKFIFADGSIEEIETEYPESGDKYIKTTKSLRLNPLKKDLASGEISLKNYTAEPQEKKFEYKYTGEDK